MANLYLLVDSLVIPSFGATSTEETQVVLVVSRHGSSAYISPALTIKTDRQSLPDRFHCSLLYLASSLIYIYGNSGLPWATMAPEHHHASANRFLVLEDMTEDGTQSSEASVYQEADDNPASSRSFTRWMGVLRSPKAQQPEKYVEGWPNDLQSEEESPNQTVQDQQWECLSGYSSQLGTVKTASLSAASQSAGRSRGTTQSTVNPSSSSESRRSNELERLRTTISPLSLGADAQDRAIKRRKVIDEILKSEADYILGLKALINNVLLSLYIVV